jgi:hypothetical protein
MHDEWSGDSQDVCRVVRAEFLILGEDSDTLALEEMAECSLKQRRGFQRQPDDLILARLAANPDLDLIALAELVEVLAALRSWSESSTNCSTWAVMWSSEGVREEIYLALGGSGCGLSMT